MIRSFLFQVDTREPLSPGRAYAFYSCLLSLLPEEYADAVHNQGETPVSQCVYCKNGQSFWRIQLLNDFACDGFSETLQGLKTLPTNAGDVCLQLVEEKHVTADELIKKSRAMEADRFFTLRILSPTAFKQSGRYTVLPDKELMLQSLLNKWNLSFPSYPLEDEDAFRMLSDGIRVSDYNLRTTRFILKDTRIPGFIGNVRFDTHLSPPLLDICKILFTFSEYSGIGIKTALGMGGIQISL